MSSRQCKALRLEHVPTPEEVRAFYDTIAAEPGFQAGIYRADHQCQRFRRLKELLSIILPFAPRVLEVGCGDGLLTRWLAARADWVVGIDMARPCIERCRALGLSNVAFFHGTLEEYEEKLLESGWYGFDLAIASEVLEHTFDPAEEVARLGRLASVILATVPITETPNPDAFSIEAFRHPKKAGDGTGHIWCFRPDTFKALFKHIYHYEEIGVSALILGR